MTLNIRKHYIDNLRWIILLILIPYHTAMAWNAWGEPNYIFFEENRLISSIIVFFSPYFMPLLFVLAGISTKFALQKRTNKEYLIERTKRLLVPFLFGTIVLMPVMTYIADKFNYDYSGGFLEHYAIFFTKYTDLTGADGGFSLGQFWFLLYLLIISIVSVGILAMLKRFHFKPAKAIPFWLVCVLGLPLPLLSELLSIGGKSLVEYTYLFLWADEEFILLNNIAKYLSEWIMIIACIGLAKKYLNNSGKVSNYMKKRSFIFYIYHFIWVVLFQYVLYGVVENHTYVLYIGTVLLSYLVTFACCEISMRIPFMCFLTGTEGSKTLWN